MTNKRISFLALILFTGIVVVLADFFLLFFFGHALSILLSKFVVPIVVSIMTLLFACAVTVLGINQTVDIMDKVNGNTWFIIQLSIIFIMFCIVIMALALKKISGFYSSIIEQMENLSSIEQMENLSSEKKT